jgi:hypothetical protein
MSSQDLTHDNIAAGQFSSLLKHWRNVRRLTQIELAGDANGICAFWKPGARSRAARWCSYSEARSICRSTSATPCTSRASAGNNRRRFRRDHFLGAGDCAAATPISGSEVMFDQTCRLTG